MVPGTLPWREEKTDYNQLFTEVRGIKIASQTIVISLTLSMKEKREARVPGTMENA